MIRVATPEDAEAIAAMTRALSDHTGDTDIHKGTGDDLRAAFAHVRALIADTGSTAVGMVLFFPYYSTIRGEMGLYVQDLYVDPSARGAGLGRRLLADAAKAAQAEWNARFLILSAARDNEAALAFYDRLGLIRHNDEVQLSLEPGAFAKLTESA